MKRDWEGRGFRIELLGLKVVNEFEGGFSKRKLERSGREEEKGVAM